MTAFDAEAVDAVVEAPFGSHPGEMAGAYRKSLNASPAYVRNHEEVGKAVEEGLWYAETGQYDVIILDLMLPKVDGLTILKKIREKNNPVHVLILTAMDSLDDRVKGLEAGADDRALDRPADFAHGHTRTDGRDGRRQCCRDVVDMDAVEHLPRPHDPTRAT